MSVTIEPGPGYLVDYSTGKMWRPKREHAGRPIDALRKWDDFDFVGLTDQAAAGNMSLAVDQDGQGPEGEQPT